MIEKTIRVTALYDFYHTLLTPKQRDAMELHFMDDLSLVEIAEELEVSKQAVSDNIKRTIKMLEDYENKLRLYEKMQKRSTIIDEIREVSNDSSLMELLDNLEKIDEGGGA